ncbi:hypothetical protein HAX54_049165 [Datura stramonium]|uniref:Uncharacterized protein n=1 Tax=Datura stramonium TaxID=4076 RepID=A0ABS8WMU3_DATST|nr:hypothetical protein [Datura stramonium]
MKKFRELRRKLRAHTVHGLRRRIELYEIESQGRSGKERLVARFLGVMPPVSLPQGLSLSGIYQHIEIFPLSLHRVIFFNLRVRRVEQGKVPPADLVDVQN